MQNALTTPIVTMTSLELVDYINSERGTSAPVLAHSDFLKKVPIVLGKDAGKFSCIYKDSMNREKPCYRFPKREACLMAMSYSYDLQAKVYDRMTALEQQAAPIAPAVKDPQLAAMVLMLTQLDAQRQEQAEQRQELAEIRAKITATPEQYYTVAGYASLRGMSIDTTRAALLGRKAARLSREYDLDIGKAHSSIHGTVNTYHVDVLCETFADVDKTPKD